DPVSENFHKKLIAFLCICDTIKIVSVCFEPGGGAAGKLFPERKKPPVQIGLDIGSTTIKCAVLDAEGKLVYKSYERHFSHIVEKAEEVLRRLDDELVHGAPVRLSISGSAGMGLADACGVPFVQEVFATRVAAKAYAPSADVIIELGGE